MDDPQPKWGSHDYFVRLRLTTEDGTSEHFLPATKRQYDACGHLHRQKEWNMLDVAYLDRTKEWLMKYLRLYRRHLGLPSLGPLIPLDDIEIVSFGKVRSKHQREALKGEAGLFV